MKSILIDEKKNLILSNETEMSRQLALHVIEKPEPRVWMIFIPVFFVFYFWKLKEYENGLNSFAAQYLALRRTTLEAVYQAQVEGKKLDAVKMIDRIRDLPESARPSCEAWLKLLIVHYEQLLSARGDSFVALVRSNYKSKVSYLLICTQLNSAEISFNLELLPTTEGERMHLHEVNDKIHEGMQLLRKQEAEKIF